MKNDENKDKQRASSVAMTIFLIALLSLLGLYIYTRYPNNSAMEIVNNVFNQLMPGNKNCLFDASCTETLPIQVKATIEDRYLCQHSREFTIIRYSDGSSFLKRNTGNITIPQLSKDGTWQNEDGSFVFGKDENGVYVDEMGTKTYYGCSIVQS